MKLGMLNDGDGDGVGALPFHEIADWLDIHRHEVVKEQTDPTSASRQNHTPPHSPGLQGDLPGRAKVVRRAQILL